MPLLAVISSKKTTASRSMDELDAIHVELLDHPCGSGKDMKARPNKLRGMVAGAYSPTRVDCLSAESFGNAILAFQNLDSSSEGDESDSESDQ
mmetsp:Transcript_3453/g.6586  ORF Transcript_3453/g.6586 Transcript_3453/m.6586 type:complete len:93 (-) Transcript_3453:167-445(-)